MSVLLVRLSGRKLQNRMRLEIELQMLAAFVCIYYRDTAAVFEVKKPNGFDIAAPDL